MIACLYMPPNLNKPHVLICSVLLLSVSDEMEACFVWSICCRHFIKVVLQGNSHVEGGDQDYCWFPSHLWCFAVESLRPDSLFFVNPCCEWLQMETREREEESKAACAANDGEKCTACMIVWQIFLISMSISYFILQLIFILWYI